MAEIERDPAVTVFFEVKLDAAALSLGAFTGCEGLGCEVTIEQREEGGNNAFIHQLPGRIKYSNVKLTRAVNEDTKKIASWFSSLHTGLTKTNATIIAKNAEGKPVWQWVLQNVVPVRWQGPSLNADSPKVATETLEIAHHGFLAGG
jgi:phage tail-like protein